MSYGLPWSERFVRQLADKEVRSEFVADQMRARIAQLIRTLREQADRNWTQAELGERAGKPQNVISRFENPDYGKMSLQSLFEIAAAFDLPIWVDIPEWKDWFSLINDFPTNSTHRSAFDLKKLVEQANMVTTPPPGSAAASAAQAIKNMLIEQQQPINNVGAAMNANNAQSSLVHQVNPVTATTNVASAGNIAA
jgi:transcriptional regulator with XRE-family HTH domain